MYRWKEQLDNIKYRCAIQKKINIAPLWITDSQRKSIIAELLRSANAAAATKKQITHIQQFFRLRAAEFILTNKLLSSWSDDHKWLFWFSVYHESWISHVSLLYIIVASFADVHSTDSVMESPHWCYIYWEFAWNRCTSRTSICTRKVYFMDKIL